MKVQAALLGLLALGCLSIGGLHARPQQKQEPERKPEKQVVVRVHKSEKGLEYVLDANKYKKRDANYALAELKLQKGADCQVIAIIDDNADLGAITKFSEMAINAGFLDIRPYVYWRETGRMAEIQFGPPIKFTNDADKIARREKHN